MAGFTPAVSAIAVGFEHEHGGEEVGLVIRAKENSEVFDQINKFLIQTIPDYMRPRAVVFTENEIRSPQGKAKRWLFRNYFLPLKNKILGKNIINLGQV